MRGSCLATPSRSIATRLSSLLVCLTLATCSPHTRAPSHPVEPASGEKPHTSQATPLDAATSAPMSSADAYHLLSRLTFGVRQEDLAFAKTHSAKAWLEWQLKPETIDDSLAEGLERPYLQTLQGSSQVRHAYKKTIERTNRRNPGMVVEKTALDSQRLLQDAQMLQAAHQIASKRQLLETMVDFWFNHFNVYARKGTVKLTISDYVEHAIRAHALGHFDDLLIATARHPAMLVYLDNYLSSASPKDAAPGKSGITENYSRELLELHTLGVHGGYTQQDVIQVARIFSGWTIEKDRDDNLRFSFNPEKHLAGSKIVLGKTYRSQGESEGLNLLRDLARHPATARHLAQKLCQRFVTDDPPEDCLRVATKSYMQSQGDISSVLRSIVASPQFWAADARRSKLKSPYRFLISACRTLGIVPDAFRLSQLSLRLGAPPLLQPVPTGYPERSDAWLSTAGLLSRFNVATGLSTGRMRGAQFDLDALMNVVDNTALVDRTNQVIFAGTASESTLSLIRQRIEREPRLTDKRRYALALALGSPDFQRE